MKIDCFMKIFTFVFTIIMLLCFSCSENKTTKIYIGQDNNSDELPPSSTNSLNHIEVFSDIASGIIGKKIVDLEYNNSVIYALVDDSDSYLASKFVVYKIEKFINNWQLSCKIELYNEDDEYIYLADSLQLVLEDKYLFLSYQSTPSYTAAIGCGSMTYSIIDLVDNESYFIQYNGDRGRYINDEDYSLVVLRKGEITYSPNCDSNNKTEIVNYLENRIRHSPYIESRVSDINHYSNFVEKFKLNNPNIDGQMFNNYKIGEQLYYMDIVNYIRGVDFQCDTIVSEKYKIILVDKNGIILYDIKTGAYLPIFLYRCNVCVYWCQLKDQILKISVGEENKYYYFDLENKMYLNVLLFDTEIDI